MKLAINKTFINKATSNDFRLANKSFTNVNITPEELAKHINEGYSFCSQHKNNYKKSSNFTCSDILAVDVDDGLTLEEALEDEYIKRYCSLVYTTFNHSGSFNRFRLVFELQETIVDVVKIKNALAGISKKFGGDPSCTDACRMFYGSKECNPIVLGKTLPIEEVDLLMKLGKESNNNNNYIDNTAVNSHSPFRSINTIDQDVEVQTKDGIFHRLMDLPPKTSIHCPVHIDKNASAFTITNKRGVIGVYCSKCQTSYYTSRDIPLYDFDYGLSSLDKLPDTDTVIIEKDEIFGDIKHVIQSIIKYKETYLPNEEVDTPLVFVKSPKGSGKTEWLKRVVEKAKKNNLSILLIGHRRSLITSVSERLRLTPYIEFTQNSKTGKSVESIKFIKPTKHYAICVDSLYNLLTPSSHKYDVILIDEVEQVFSHLTSSTIKGIRNETYKIFKHYVDVASQVYVMDADLNSLTVETVSDFLSDKNKLVTVIVNEPPQNNGVIEIFEGHDQLVNELITSINTNNRCYVCSNSKRKIHQLSKILEDMYGEEKRIMWITGDNSHKSEIQYFIRNIKTEILNYDVILVSPSVGTGVDITFPQNNQEIDYVYGLFESTINTHLDIDQQISRVRHPSNVRIWISPETFRFETESEVIKREVYSVNTATRRLLHYETDGTAVYDTNDGYLNLYSNVKSLQRGSKNHLKQHFIKMKKYYGWKITNIKYDKELSKTGREHMKTGKKLQLQEKIDLILSSSLITQDEYIELNKIKDKISLTDNQTWSMRRYEIESFYYQDITHELIENDNDSLLRKQIREYELFHTDNSELIAREKGINNIKSHITDKKNLLVKKKFLHDVFKLSGLINEKSEFIPDKEITSENLSDFTDYVKKNDKKIQQWYEKSIRKDIVNKPVTQLNEFLRIVGLKTKSTSRKPGGVRKYYYWIPKENIDYLNEISNRRNDSELTEKWILNRDSKTENRLFEEDQDVQYQVKLQIRHSTMEE